MNHENPIIKELQIKVSPLGWRLFRNHAIRAWVGKFINKKKTSKGIMITLLGAVSLKFGLTDDASDLIGWRPIVVTPEMVGQVIAQFCAVEVKTKAYTKETKGQKNFLVRVKEAGGYSGIYREGEKEIDDI